MPPPKLPFASKPSTGQDMGDSEVACEICGTTFWHKWSLASALANRSRHMREVHKSPQSFSCNECGKTFTRKDKLKDHVKNVHSDNKESFPCTQCEKTFSRKDNLQRHVKDTHKGEQRFECPKCPEDFSRSGNLKKHQERGKHTITVDCEYCYQELDFKSVAAKDRHFIAIPKQPSLATCRNAKYGLGKMPTEEERDAFMTRRGKEQGAIELKEKAEKHFRSCYSHSCKCEAHEFAVRAHRENWEEFEKRFMREEREKSKKRAEYWEKRDFNEYDADESMICPYSKDPIQKPVRNKECGHVYDRDSLLNHIKRCNKISAKSTCIAVCLKKSKDNEYCMSRILSLDDDLEPDEVLEAEIEKRREKKRKEKEEKKKKDAEKFAENWERRKRQREEKEAKKKKKIHNAKIKKANNENHAS